MAEFRRFIGPVKVDDKGRVTIPGPVRSMLAGALHATSLDGESIRIYRGEDWERLRGGLEEEAPAGPGCETSVDRDGRMLLTPDLCELTGMKRKLWLRCHGGYAELTRKDPLEIFEVPESGA